MDVAIFELINQQFANPVLDAILPIYRNKLTWVPAYLLVLFLLWRAYGTRRTLYLLVCIGAVIAVADQLAATVIKPWVGRLRPCAEPGVMDRVRMLVGCGGKFGFPSNHAVNHFALATILSMTWLRNHALGWKIVLFLWAATIGLAQVYVGKHYPGDVLAGALLGSLLAIMGVMLYRRFTGASAVGERMPSRD